MAHTKEGITESARKLIVVPIKRNIKRGYLDIFKHPLGTKDPRVKKGVKKEVAEERKGEPARKAGDFGMSARKLTREMTKDEKAAELTRKMERGYRKGYRVPKRPKRGNGRKANRSSRKSGR